MRAASEKFLERLINSVSPSGYEDEAAAVWKAEANKFADKVETDHHGNSYATVGKGRKPRVMLAGHYDEIGFIITHIDDKGYLWIRPIGGWDPQIAQGQRVKVRGAKGHVYGAIGKKAIHLMTPEDRSKVVPLKDLWVDIGARDRKQAEKVVAVGDPLVIASDYARLLGDLAVGRGFDNRAGAHAVLEAARLYKKMTSAKAELVSVATVQEEIGLRGAKTSAHRLDPLVGIAVDLTFACDHPNIGDAVRSENNVKMGGGPVICRGANINPKLFNLIVKTAKEEKIPYQISAEGGGTGTDANAIQLNRSGVVTGLISIPNRYMHSPVEIINLVDLENTAKLLAHTVARITSRTNFIPF